jgi:hypothetical protein
MFRVSSVADLEQVLIAFRMRNEGLTEVSALVLPEPSPTL